MKKIIVCLLCCALLCGCSGIGQPVKKEKISVVTTVFPLYDFACAIGGELIESKMLIRPGTEVHSFEPLPSDMAAIYDCDLFLYIGGESDTWADALIGGGNVNALSLLDCVGIEDEHTHHGHTHADEHIWTSPDNAVLMLESICQSFIECDQKNAALYRKNCDAYIKKINVASKQIETLVSMCNNPFILVADRFPFLYFTEKYGIEYESAFDGCAVSTDISLKTMLRLTEIIDKKDIKNIYCTELSNKSIAKALNEELGVEIIELHSAHNVTLDDFNSGITYVDILYRNMKALERGLF